MEKQLSQTTSVQSTISLEQNMETPQWIKSKADLELYQSTIHPKISELEEIVFDTKISIFITCWRTVLGIKDPLSNEELIILSNHIKTLYSELTIEQLYLAINKSMIGVLKDINKKPLDVKVYNNFSALYVSEILNGFIRYQNDEMNRILKEKYNDEMSKKHEVKQLRFNERAASRRYYIHYFIEQINSDNTPFYDKNDVAWNFFIKNELIDPAQAERIDLKEQALKTSRIGKTPLEISLMSADSNDIVVKHLAMKEYLKTNTVDVMTFTDEQMML